MNRIDLARSLLAKGGVLESTGGGEAIARDELVAALENRILSDASLRGALPSKVTAKAAAFAALTHAESALNKTESSNLTDLEISSLEAIIEVTGRPALRYEQGKVQTPPNALGDNGHWQVLVVTAKKDINRVSGAVGRIAVTNNLGLAESIGTGWRIGTDLIVTNRHVAVLIASNPDEPPSAWKIDNSKQPYVDFAVTDSAPAASRFQITELVFVATEPLIDMAFLRVKSETSPVPESLIIDWDKEAPGREIDGGNGSPVFQGREIYVVGHPYRQGHSELVTSVFGVADGMKRCSPGLVTRMDDPNPRLEHDCSTLGGNSGSCVFTCDTHEVIGIHVGGVDVDDITAKGSTNLALVLTRLEAHRAGVILQTGGI